jgi:hypothetical protein
MESEKCYEECTAVYVLMQERARKTVVSRGCGRRRVTAENGGEEKHVSEVCRRRKRQNEDTGRRRRKNSLI